MRVNHGIGGSTLYTRTQKKNPNMSSDDVINKIRQKYYPNLSKPKTTPKVNSTSSSSGSAEPYVAPKPAFKPTAAPKQQSMGALRKQYNNINVGGAPKLPDKINVNDYNWQEATIKDLEQKYGFDYSRDYAARIAEAQAQAKRDEITSQRERIDLEKGQAEDALGHDYFKQYLSQRQDIANSGLNAGLANEREIRLEMNRQGELADIYDNANQSQRELDRNAQLIEQERIAQEDQLFQERLNTAFQQTMTLTGERRQKALAQLDRAIQQRNQEVQERWQQHEYNSMSASEYEKYLQQIRQQDYGNALDRWQAENQMRYNASR